jgi:hypothetical protein
VGGFGDKKALFPTGFVKFFVEYTRFRLQNLPNQSKKWRFFSLKATHRNKSIGQLQFPDCKNLSFLLTLLHEKTRPVYFPAALPGSAPF